MPKVFSLPIFTKEFRRSVPSVILWFLISGGLSGGAFSGVPAG